MSARALIALALLLVCCGCRPGGRPVPRDTEQVVTSSVEGYSMLIPKDWSVKWSSPVLLVVSPGFGEAEGSWASIMAIFDPSLDQAGSEDQYLVDFEKMISNMGEGDLQREDWNHPLGRALKYRIATEKEGVTIYQTVFQLVGNTHCSLMCKCWGDDPDAFQDVFDRAFDTWRPGDAAGRGD